MQFHILWSIEGKLKAHVVQCLRNLHATVEVHTSSYTATARYRSLRTLSGRNVQCGIHGVSSEFNVRAVLNGKRLQRNDWQRVLHLAVRQGIASTQLEIISRRVLHAQGTTAHQVDVVRVVGVQIGHHMGTIRHVDGHIHLETIQWRTLDDNLCSVAEVGKLHQFVQLVVGCQW